MCVCARVRPRVPVENFDRVPNGCRRTGTLSNDTLVVRGRRQRFGSFRNLSILLSSQGRRTPFSHAERASSRQPVTSNVTNTIRIRRTLHVVVRIFDGNETIQKPKKGDGGDIIAMSSPLLSLFVIRRPRVRTFRTGSSVVRKSCTVIASRRNNCFPDFPAD